MNNQYKEKTLYASGMHCASCEILIEKRLLKNQKVKSADASLKNSEVRLLLDDDGELNLSEINSDLKKYGYQLSGSPFAVKPNGLFVKNKRGELKLNPEKAKGILKNLLLVFGLIIGFIVMERLQLGKYVSVQEGATLSAFMLLGLVAGVSSCAALIGGLLLSLVKRWHEQYIDSESTLERSTPHLLFHGGRLASFFVLGGMLGIVGDAMTFDNTATYALLVLIVSAVMILLSLQMLNVRWAARFIPRMPKAITRAAAAEGNNSSKFMPFLTGAATFFLPCGFTLIAQGVALASGSFIVGALVMTYFALGTLPALVIISATGLKFTSKPHLTARFSVVAGILILFFALYNINGQLNVLGLPSLSDIVATRTSEEVNPQQALPEEIQGKQVLSLIAKDFDYIAAGPINLNAGEPTTLVVDNQGILGCGAYMASNGLIKGFVALNPGQNLIDLGKPKAGTYKITCSMGMVAPLTVYFK